MTTRLHAAGLLTAGLLLGLATGCASADDDTAVADRGPAPGTAAASSTASSSGPATPPLSEVPGSASPVPTRALPPPVVPQGPTDSHKPRTVTGQLTDRADGCRVLRDGQGMDYLLRGDGAAAVPAGPASVRGSVEVRDDGPCSGLALVVA